MEEQLEIAILAGENDEDIELLILHNVIGEPINVNIYENFRFMRNDLLGLKNALGIPNRVVTDTRNSVDGLTALCILLRRLCYPNRLAELQSLFNYSPQSLSQITKTTANLIVNNYGHLLDNLNAHHWLNQDRCRLYAQSIIDMGGAVDKCWGFIDGTTRQICRPTHNQEEYYSGHKRIHCVKYQSVLSPDGIIVNLNGGFPGRRHDAGIFRDSNLYEQLEQNLMFPHNENYALYGDQAYGLRPLLLSPFPGHPANLLPHQIAFNNSMKVLRGAVEWGFQKIITQFAFIDLKKNQKVLISDIEILYKCAVLLTNCHTCLYRSQTSDYFNVIPPGLGEYLG